MEPAIDVTVLRQEYEVPDRCAHCFKADTLIPKKIGYDPRKLKMDKKETDHPDDILPEFGFCQRCARWQSVRSIVGGIVIGIGILAAIAVLIAIPVHLPHRIGRWLGAILVFLFCLPGMYILNVRDPNVQLLAFTGETLTFSFRRADYANQFMKLNKVGTDATDYPPASAND